MRKCKNVKILDYKCFCRSADFILFHYHLFSNERNNEHFYFNAICVQKTAQAKFIPQNTCIQ